MTGDTFWRRVRVKDDKSCWEWCGRLDRDGYGLVGSRKFKGQRAHRVAFILSSGPIQPHAPGSRSVIRHSCDNPPCCNPAHLSLGSDADNVRDKLSRGRSVIQIVFTLAESDKLRAAIPPGIQAKEFVLNAVNVAAELPIRIDKDKGGRPLSGTVRWLKKSARWGARFTLEDGSRSDFYPLPSYVGPEDKLTAKAVAASMARDMRAK